MPRLSKVQTGLVRLSFILLLLMLTLSLGACGCSRQEESEAPVDTAEPSADEGKPSVSVPEPDHEAKQDIIFDAKAVKVGDKVLGMEIMNLLVNDIDEKSYSVRAKFSGQATVSGTYTHEEEDVEMLRCKIRFDVDAESEACLPREKNDKRILWFVFTNHDEAEKLLGPPGSSGKATVVIDEYAINYTFSDEYNTAKLIRVIEKG